MIDNMFTGRKKNVGHWIGHPNFMLIVHDVVEPIMLEVRAGPPPRLWRRISAPVGGRSRASYPRLKPLLSPSRVCCLSARQVDQIYHLACPASPPHYQYNPIKTIKTSTMGTLNMLGLAKRVRARMLLTSTSEVRRTHRGWGPLRDLAAHATPAFWCLWGRCMATRRCTLSPSRTGAMSTPSAHVPATMRASVWPRP